ncbi:hypothetical protein FNQ90_19730, partial [Streptomyces alkaliphilus]|nr:hypothetical protein [Streptomyces alkaliphilus]
MTERDRERGEGREPIDEEAAWAAIVAGWDEEPAGRTGGTDTGDDTGGGESPSNGQVAEVGDASGGGEPGAGDGTPGDSGDVKEAGGETGPSARDGGAQDAAPAGAPVVNRAADWLAGAPGAGLPAGAPGEDPGKGPWNGPGPRDWAPAEEEDEGHFVPPEPP